MLALEMSKLSEQDLDSTVGQYCSSFGSPTVLNVLPPRDHNNPGAAAVRMASEAEAEELARNAGGSRCGTKVIIKLVLDAERMPTITRHSFLHSSNAASAMYGLPLTEDGVALSGSAWFAEQVEGQATVSAA
jgi:hypothetical protein